MPIETNCPGCGKRLQVADEHAGKNARCPNCQTIYVVPGGAPPPAPPINPFADVNPPTSATPYSSAASYGPVVSAGRYQPHRGGVILTLALVGWFICPILCIVAWIMGANDVKQIRAGRMDPSGLGLTQAGMIIGAVITVLNLIGIFCFCLAGLLGS